MEDRASYSDTATTAYAFFGWTGSEIGSSIGLYVCLIRDLAHAPLHQPRHSSQLAGHNLLRRRRRRNLDTQDCYVTVPHRLCMDSICVTMTLPATSVIVIKTRAGRALLGESAILLFV
jgi:hypothetical protein